MESPLNHFSGKSEEIGGYAMVRPLPGGRAWLARAPGGRLVVLKALEEDCLWKGQLHPNVKDRLGRVRELAHVGVANLYGVERSDGVAWMVWEHVEGRTLDEVVRTAAWPQRDLILLARELVLDLEVLHARGIVHGAIKASNVIILDAGEAKVMLTHVSPLLYSDPREDVRAATVMLSRLVQEREEAATPLSRLLEEAAQSPEWSLRQLAGRLGALLESNEDQQAAAPPGGEMSRLRRRTLLGAAAVAAVGVALFAGIRLYAGSREPRPPTPPEARPAALEPDVAGAGEAP